METTNLLDGKAKSTLPLSSFKLNYKPISNHQSELDWWEGNKYKFYVHQLQIQPKPIHFYLESNAADNFISLKYIINKLGHTNRNFVFET